VPSLISNACLTWKPAVWTELSHVDGSSNAEATLAAWLCSVLPLLYRLCCDLGLGLLRCQRHGLDQTWKAAYLPTNGQSSTVQVVAFGFSAVDLTGSQVVRSYRVDGTVVSWSRCYPWCRSLPRCSL
jgi:hypothetical protein